MKARQLILGVGMMCAMLSGRAGTVFLECEAFDDWGGWANDTQFMDQMGSSYLLAHGLGRPVADAKTTFVVPKSGAHDVWVRTKNWLAWVNARQGRNCGGDFPGMFKLVVNGVELPTTLGVQGTGEWLWTKAGTVELKEGKNTVALHDLDGFDGRCDAVVFTTEADPDRHLNGPRRPTRLVRRRALPQYDLCVVGAGVGGICTAVAAARLGLKVALVHDRPVLGGNNSSEVRVHLGAWQNMPPYPRLGDVLAEFGPPTGGNAEGAANYRDDAKMRIVKAEKNIALYLNRRVNGVETNAVGAIVSVLATDTRYGDPLYVRARWFADTTGDGTVGYLAGADYRMGREAKGETGEPWAPEKADMLTMGASVQWRAHTVADAEPFPLRDWMIRFDDSNGRAEMKGDWDWEAGLGRDQIKEAEYIRDYGLLVAFSNWAYAKNVAKKKDEFRNKELEWVAYIAGRRETRRLLGDFILTEKDIQAKNFQPDGTCATTWTIDLHFPKTEKETHFAGEPFRSNSENEKIWPYPIPYRCLYSRNVPNLFMAGRDISVTHIALGTTRLMRTIGMMGEVVGMAASVCKKNGCDPRGVYTDHLDELKALMEKGVGDGKAHPPQMYNIQDSLDPVFRDKKSGNHQLPSAAGELKLLWPPHQNWEVQLLSKAQKEYLQKPLAERVEDFADAGKRAILRIDQNAPTPVLLSWSWTPAAGGVAPQFTVHVCRDDGLPVMTKDVRENYVKIDNLEIGRGYSWTVYAKAGGRILDRATGGFRTDPTPPRLIRVDGVNNVRDLGGRIGLGGRKIRQGLVFRSAGLNDNPTDIAFLTPEMAKVEFDAGTLTNRTCWQAEHMAKIFRGEWDANDWHLVPVAQSARGEQVLTDEGRRTMLETLGIRTDLDLRGSGEVAGMKGSPLGDSVKWVNVKMTAYGGIGKPEGRKLVRECFDVFLDKENYPIDFHCIGGQDRTGTLAFLLEAVLGVDDEELNRDWECSGFTNPKVWFRHEQLFNQIYDVINQYPGANTREKVEAYLKECGLTDDDFAFLRGLLLENDK